MPQPTFATLGSALESILVYIKNGRTNNIDRVATSVGLQVGLNSSPAELNVTGRICVNVTDVTLSQNQIYQIDSNSTVINVTTTSATGSVTVILPEKPRAGQLVVIKDYSGNSHLSRINVTGSGQGNAQHLIDGYTTKIIENRYASLSLVWQGSSWAIVSGESRSILTFGASTMSAKTAGTYWLLPGGPGDVASPFSLSPGIPLISSPTSGKIRNFYVAQNGAGSLTSGNANMIYTVYINGSATSLQVTIDVATVAVVSDTNYAHEAAVKAGDLISISATQPGSINNSVDNIVT